MKRPIALAAAAGILLGGCAVDKEPGGIRASAGKRPTAIEMLATDVDRDIIPRLGSAGLILIFNKQDQATHSVSLVVTRDTYCASEFSFSKNDRNNRNNSVRLDLFGNYIDLIDVRQLDGSAMYDGTIGHGDNVDAAIVEYVPGHPASTAAALEYMRRTTDEACEVMNQPPAK